MMSKSARRSIAVGAGLGLVTMASVAFAGFLGTTVARVDGTAGQLKPPAVHASVVDPMWPGYLNDAKVTVANPNPVAITITSSSFRSLGGTTIPPEDLTSRPGAENEVVNKPIPANETVEFLVSDALGLSADASSAAQGKTLSFDMTATFQAVAGTETAGTYNP